VGAADVTVLLTALEKGLRAFQLYQGSNPALDRFIEALRQRFAAFWKAEPVLEVEVDEREMRWEDEVVYGRQAASENLAALLHRDGIRQISFHPGFEGGDLPRLLDVLSRALRSQRQHDDLITLLWNEDFLHFHYRYVDLLADRTELPGEAAQEAPDAVPEEEVRGEAAAAPDASLRPEDFREALYFLEPAELRRLEAAVEADRRDGHWLAVLNALLDRFEDGSPDRRRQVLAVVVEVLPLLLANQRFEEAAHLLRELTASPPPDGGEGQEELAMVLEDLARPETVTELLAMLRDAPKRLGSAAVADFIALLPPTALPQLVREVAAEGEGDAGERLLTALLPLAERAPSEVIGLLRTDEEPLLVGGCRLVAAGSLRSAAVDLVRLVGHAAAPVRIAAIQALGQVRSAEAGRGLLAALNDSDRDVRVHAARGLARLRYAPALDDLRNRVTSRQAREADFTERMALFEAFGAVCGAEGVDVLDRMLNGRKLFGRKDPAEVRACAAMALGMIGDASARGALMGASRDPDPVVRTAVSRALRGER
jgi:HEAT repeat protein